ncbi:MAG: hypothetical protein WCT46_02195 [Candidatus Gracilibacteria bacterium]|jgi:hypothetical protein
MSPKPPDKKGELLQFPTPKGFSLAEVVARSQTLQEIEARYRYFARNGETTESTEGSDSDARLIRIALVLTREIQSPDEEQLAREILTGLIQGGLPHQPINLREIIEICVMRAQAIATVDEDYELAVKLIAILLNVRRDIIENPPEESRELEQKIRELFNIEPNPTR